MPKHGRHDAQASPPSERAELTVLVVTKMWPTIETSFRNGFLKLQVEALQRRGVSCDVLVAPAGLRGLFGYLRIALAVRRAVSSGRYDLIHAHYGLTATSCLFQPLPLVVTFHGSDIYGAINASARRTLKGVVERLASKLVAWRADIVIVVSSRMVTAIPRAKPVVVPVGIDTALFRPMSQDDARRRLGLEPYKPYILFAADPNNPVKRHWLASEAVSLVKQRHPQATLLAVSGEPLARMPLWMNAADVLLITSAFEGGPMVHREAMACNLPVVSVDVGDVGLHISEVTQSHVVADDPCALARAIELVLTEGSRSNGRAFATRTNSDSTANAISDIYSMLVSHTDSGLRS
jgi:teichuronic acid biosynthesis glycosyltransferase TuaC